MSNGAALRSQAFRVDGCSLRQMYEQLADEISGQQRGHHGKLYRCYLYLRSWHQILCSENFGH
jgi:hypothetical protein